MLSNNMNKMFPYIFDIFCGFGRTRNKDNTSSPELLESLLIRCLLECTEMPSVGILESLYTYVYTSTQLNLNLCARARHTSTEQMNKVV